MSESSGELNVPWEIKDVDKNREEVDARAFCELVSFDYAYVIPGIVNGTWFAFVCGEARCFNMSVTLQPLIYVKKPEYWEIQVIGCVGEICLPAQRPYYAGLDVTNFLGHKGIEIVGSNRSKKFEIS